jgi:hypothetical protein
LADLVQQGFAGWPSRRSGGIDAVKGLFHVHIDDPAIARREVLFGSIQRLVGITRPGRKPKLASENVGSLCGLSTCSSAC